MKKTVAKSQKQKTKSSIKQHPQSLSPEDRNDNQNPETEKKDQQIKSKIQSSAEEIKQSQAEVIKKVKRGLFTIIQTQYEDYMKPMEKQERQSSVEFKEKPQEKIQSEKKQKRALKNSLAYLIQRQYNSYMGIEQDSQRSQNLQNPKQKEKLEEGEQIQNQNHKEIQGSTQKLTKNSSNLKQENKFNRKQIKDTAEKSMKNSSNLKQENNLKISKQSIKKDEPYQNKSSIVQKSASHKKIQVNKHPNYHKQSKMTVRKEDQKKQESQQFYRNKSQSQNYGNNTQKYQNNKKQHGMFPSILKKSKVEDQEEEKTPISQKKSVTFDNNKRSKTEQFEYTPMIPVRKPKKFNYSQIYTQERSYRNIPDTLDIQIIERVKTNPGILDERSRNLSEIQKMKYVQKAAQQIRNEGFSASLKKKLSTIRNIKQPTSTGKYPKLYSPLQSYLT